MPTKTLLKLAFIVLSTHYFAFAGSDSYNGQDFNEANLERKHPNHLSAGELLPTDSLALVEAPAAQGTLEWPPREIIGQILGWLSKPDLLNVRLVNKNLGASAIPLLIDVLIPHNIPSAQQAERFFKDLTTAFWRGKEPSEAFINLFRHAPLKVLSLENLSTKLLKTLMPAFPTALEELFLSGNNLGDEEIKEVVQHLPTTFLLLYLSNNNIGDDGAKTLAEKLPTTLIQLCLGGNNIGNEGAKALAEKLPTGLLFLFLDGNNIGDEGLKALLAAIPRTDLKHLTISVPEGSPLREQFNNLHNRQGQPIMVTFM